jgi:hypothetical protein
MTEPASPTASAFAPSRRVRSTALAKLGLRKATFGSQLGFEGTNRNRQGYSLITR